MFAIALLAASAVTQITHDEIKAKMEMKFSKILPLARSRSKDNEGSTVPVSPTPVARTAKMHYTVEKYMRPDIDAEPQEITFTTLCEKTIDVSVYDLTQTSTFLRNTEPELCKANLKATAAGESDRPFEIKIWPSLLLFPVAMSPASKAFIAWMEVMPSDEPWSYNSRRYDTISVINDYDTKHLNSYLEYESLADGENILVTVEFED